MNNNLSLLKIINGLSRTINIANQMLPLYNKIKPIILKGNELLSNINLSKSQPEITQNNISKETQQKENTSLPTFFQ